MPNTTQLSGNKKCIFASVVKIFLGNRSGVLLLLPPLIAIYVLTNCYLGYHAPETSSTGFFGVGLNEDQLWVKIAGPLLIFLNAILLNNIFNRNGFMERNIYLPSLLYVVFHSYFHSFYFLNGFIVAELLLILTLIQLYKLDQNSDGRRAIFNGAFLLGLATTMYPLMMISIPFLFWMIWVFRPFVIRESALAVVGFILPLIYAGFYGSIFGVELTGDFLSSSSSEWKFPDLLVLGAGALLLQLFATGPVLSKLSKSSIRLKKVFRLNILLSLFIAALSTVEFIVYGKAESMVMITGIIILFLPYAFGDRKPRVLPTFLFYLIFFFSVGKFFISFEF